MKTVRVKIMRNPNNTIVLLKTYSYNIQNIQDCLKIIFILLSLAIEYEGMLSLSQGLSFPNIEGKEGVVVQVQLYFGSQESIDEFEQFIREII